MALRGLIILAVITIALSAVQHEAETQTKAKKTVAAEKAKPRSAHPDPSRGSFQELTSLLNKTEKSRRRSKDPNTINKIRKMNRDHKAQNDMMNDNEGAIAMKAGDNDTNSLNKKMKELRQEGPTYEAINKNNYVPRISGIYCNFENSTSGVDLCTWQWNTTVSSHGLGFKVMNAEDVQRVNESTRDLQFSGPSADADGNPDGHFLYLPVDPAMDNMVIKSPPFRGLWEFCKIEASLHQSKMGNASIRLISETTISEVQWILQEITGNNAEKWSIMRFTIGKVLQEIRIIIEISRPAHISLDSTLPHIAIDNIRMVECLPEPPVFDGNCQAGQLKCMIMNKESCIKLQQVCDLIKDCDDGSDENQNCDKMPYGSYCNFEQDNCGFVNIPQPILKWSRHSGPTPTDKTGPNFDHTCGPPDLYPPSVVVPPLSPAHLNLTLSQCLGYYFFVNMNVTGPNQERADFASSAVMKTVVFNPPPKVHGNISSQYYNCCMIRFYYQQNGRNYGSLSVDLVEISSRGNITTELWFSTKDKGEHWFRAGIFLPNVTRRYYLQFKTRMGMRIYSDSAIDDFSLAPECFGINVDPRELGDYNYYSPEVDTVAVPHPAFEHSDFYRFTPCGATGRYGPNQTMCNAAYNNTSVSVTVIQEGPYQGIQSWEVPHEGFYTILAVGGSGGLGSAWSGVSHAASVRTLFELHKGETIYMLVGQQGLNACKKTLSQDSQTCSKLNKEESQIQYTSKTHEVRNTHVQDGGGGGGGGTYVFVMDKEGTLHALVVAGGGGGISVGVFREDGSQHARLHGNTSSARNSYNQGSNAAGPGGGWSGSTGLVPAAAGRGLRAGGAGGVACWGGAHGGFGGGGGGCMTGGGGGGWFGGSTNTGLHGGGGYSHISPRAVTEMSAVSLSPHMAPGEVLIIPAIHACDCAYRCVALNEYRSSVKCYCPMQWRTDTNGTRCILEDGTGWLTSSWVVFLGLGGTVVLSVAMLLICLHLYNTFQRKKEEESRRKRLLEQEVQLHRLRNPPGGCEGGLTAFNPHYGSEGFLPQGIDVRQLPQVTRESLRLLKALGQGAFGEVYQGLYRHRTGDSVEMPVAVKTLPELSTGQAESDFLMEAAIMAKFNHPNVVHLIGVCFDRHPRFIVLELLAGGDLKNFLRESRPRPERASALTMKDLLLCALDVCKGCRYLEAKRFIHRDIAARNCLLTSRGPGRVVKIADFGMARDIYRADYYKKGGKAMLPIKWMPPEAYIDGVFTIKTDVWSFGVLLWEIFSLGVMPYTGCANREVMEMVSGGGRLEKPQGCPQEIYRLLCECWNPTPAERPSFAQMFDRLSIFLQDPEIVGAPLPVVRQLMPQTDPDQTHTNGVQRAPPCDYLVPMSSSAGPSDDSPTEPLVPHSKSPTAAPTPNPGTQDLQYQHLLRASQEYGKIRTDARTYSARSVAEGACSDRDATLTTKFLQSNSTDRLLSSAEEPSLDPESSDVESNPPTVWETSFTEPKIAIEQPPVETGPIVDKLISITPTSPKPPENALSLAMEAPLDKAIHNKSGNLIPERKSAPIASPDPPRINAWPNDPSKQTSKIKPLCLDAAQLEQNLKALKNNSGSVNLNNMNLNTKLPPYINVVTPKKLSEAKPIQIDPKKAVIHDLQSPKEVEVKKEEGKEFPGKLKQSASAGSLLNGPMTDVPYADSDNASSSSGSNPPNHLQSIQKSKQNNYSEVNVREKSKVTKQGSNGGEFHNESEISC